MKFVLQRFRSKRTRCATRLAATAALLCGGSMPAFAGHWNITYKNQGQSIFTPIGPPNTITMNWPTSGVGPFPQGSYYGGMNVTGTIQPILTWVQDAGDNNALPPAEKVYVLVKGNAYAPNANGSGASADDGLGDAAVPDSAGGVRSSGAHLIQIDNSNQSKTLALVTYNVSARGYGGGTNVSITATLDTRSVTISYDAPVNYGKDPVTGAKQLNKRASDGSIIIDTVIDSPLWHVPSVDWSLQTWLQATTTGFDLSHVDSYNPLTATVAWDVAGPQIFTNLQTTGNPLQVIVRADGMERNLWSAVRTHIKVVDKRPGLEATAENYYTAIIHAPLENITEIAPRVFDHNEKYPWSQPVAMNGAVSVSMVAQQARQWQIAGLTADDAGAFLSGICGSGSVALIGELVPGANIPATAVIAADMAFNAIGWAVSKTGSPEPTLTVQVTPDLVVFNQAIADQKAIEQGATPDQIDCLEDDRILPASVRASVYANPMLYFNNYAITGICHSGMRYIKAFEEGDAYYVHGYKGRQKVYPVIPTRFLNKVWQFTISTAPPPPH